MNIEQIAILNYAAFIREQIIPELKQGIYTQMAFVISVLESHAEHLNLIVNDSDNLLDYNEVERKGMGGDW